MTKQKTREEPPVYKRHSAEYEGYISDLRAAKEIQNCRNRYTNATRAGKKNPFHPEIPRKPSAEELACIHAERDWKAMLKGRPDEWWVKKIKACIDEPFYQAKIALLIYWDLCDEQTLNKPLWRELSKDWDFDADLLCDWGLTEYALHRCGYSPDRARAMTYEVEGRKRMREQLGDEA